MKTTGREVAMWFVAHLAWWAVSAFVIFPMFMTPLYASLRSSGVPASELATIYMMIGLGVAIVGWVVVLMLFLVTRGSGPDAHMQPPPSPNPILGPGR
jgi:hypothetical protein